MVNKWYGTERLLNMSMKCTIKKRRKRVCAHTCTHIHREKHILNKEKYQSQLNVVLLIGSHIAASILTAVLFSLCNARVVCREKEGILELVDAAISQIFPNCRN